MSKAAHIHRARTTIAGALHGTTQKPEAGPPKLTQCPSCKDQRFTVSALPADYKSQISAEECRPFMKSVLA